MSFEEIKSTVFSTKYLPADTQRSRTSRNNLNVDFEPYSYRDKPVGLKVFYYLNLQRSSNTIKLNVKRQNVVFIILQQMPNKQPLFKIHVR